MSAANCTLVIMDAPLAPRTDAYLTNREGMWTMKVSAWPAGSSSGPVLLDPNAMPFGGAPGTICVVGEPSTSDAYVIRRYREDAKDGPQGRYNVDTFKAWIGSFPSHLDANRIATAASTSCNANWRGYEQSGVFVQQQPNGSDHWLAELPSHVRTLLATGVR
jgi:hypothetical protein